MFFQMRSCSYVDKTSKVSKEGLRSAGRNLKWERESLKCPLGLGSKDAETHLSLPSPLPQLLRKPEAKLLGEGNSEWPT